MTCQDTTQPFNREAGRYDDWFRDNPLFQIEIAALQAIREIQPHPRLEIGVGPGHFADALEVEFGIDPAISPLHLAARRSIIAVNGAGEHLPIQTGALGTAYILFTMCFLEDPAGVVRECSRVLALNGRLVLGFMPRLSAWGRRNSKRGSDGHPLYRYAHFRTVAETVRILDDSGMFILESWSTLFQQPDQHLQEEKPQPGSREDAGFCVLVTGKKGEKT